MIDIAITGVGGRMGQRLVALGHAHGAFRIVAAIERPDHPLLSHDAGEVAGIGRIGVPISFDLKPTPRVLIDFAHVSATRHWLKVCRDRDIAMVIGTTGLAEQDMASIDQAAQQIPVLQSPNMSVGVNVLFKVVGEVARLLGEGYDIEILEAHHNQKKDAPSGTARGLADAVLRGVGKTRDALTYVRYGDDCKRRPGEITMQSLRVGDEVGMHTVYYGAPGERIEITHRATSRDVFVHGALRAALWLAGQKPGRYTMAHALGL